MRLLWGSHIKCWGWLSSSAHSSPIMKSAVIHLAFSILLSDALVFTCCWAFGHFPRSSVVFFSPELLVILGCQRKCWSFVCHHVNHIGATVVQTDWLTGLQVVLWQHCRIPKYSANAGLGLVSLLVMTKSSCTVVKHWVASHSFLLPELGFPPHTTLFQWRTWQQSC